MLLRGVFTLLLCARICFPSETGSKISLQETATKFLKNSTDLPIIKFRNEKLPKIVFNKSEEVVTVSAAYTTSTVKQVNEPNAVIKNINNDKLLQSGAFMRGIYVIIGVTVMLIGYYTFKVLKKGRVSTTSRVRKYGVTANRSDVEMLPLPLSEDEDDDTVFDVNNQRNT